MKRIGRVLAALALVLPLSFSVATLLTAGGCSGSSGSGGQAAGSGEIDKAAQEKMKEYLKNKPPLKAGNQNKTK
jgi:hypothetical protein